MNILIQNPFLHSGGAENRIRSLIDELAKRPDIDEIHFMFCGDEGRHIIRNDEKVHLWDTKIGKFTSVVKNIIKEHGIDIFQYHNNQIIGLAGLQYAQQHGIPTVWVMHDFWPLCINRFMIPPFEASKFDPCIKIDPEECINCVGYYNYFLYRKYREIINNCNVGVVPSQRIKEIFEMNNTLTNKLKIITPWIILDKFKPVPEMKERQSVLFVGNFIPHKGFWVVLKAWKEVQKRLPMARLLGIGDARGLSEVQLLIRDLKLRNVRLSGRVPHEQIFQLYNKANITVFPSIWEETFGQVWAESLACATPVIASRIGSIPELLKEGGVLFKPRDHKELANHIIDLLLDEEKANMLGVKGYQYVTNAFRPDVAAQSFTEMYYRLEAGLDA